MSHITTQRVKPGQPQLRDLRAVRLAAENLGLQYLEQSHFRGFGNEVRDGAVAVLRVPEPKASQFRRRHGEEYHPHDVAIIPDPANPNCYKFAHDPYHGGFGVEEIIGPTTVDRHGNVESAYGTLLMHYQMAVAKLEAEANGDSIEFCAMADGTYEAMVNTEARLGY